MRRRSWSVAWLAAAVIAASTLVGSPVAIASKGLVQLGTTQVQELMEDLSLTGAPDCFRADAVTANPAWVALRAIETETCSASSILLLLERVRGMWKVRFIGTIDACSTLRPQLNRVAPAEVAQAVTSKNSAYCGKWNGNGDGSSISPLTRAKERCQELRSREIEIAVAVLDAYKRQGLTAYVKASRIVVRKLRASSCVLVAPDSAGRRCTDLFAYSKEGEIYGCSQRQWILWWSPEFPGPWSP